MTMQKNQVILLSVISILISLSIAAQDKQKNELYIEKGHAGMINSISFSPDGEILASGSDDATVKLWTIEEGFEIKSLEGHEGSVNSVAFSPNGEMLASGGDDNLIKLWDVKTGKFLTSIQGHTERVNSVAYSRDGKILASGSDDKTIKLWNIKNGQQIKSLEGHLLAIHSVMFSSDGKILASGSHDSTIRLWNIETGQQIRILEGHFYSVNSVAFSPDGQMLASGSWDKTVKLWDVKTGQQIKSLQGHYNWVNSVAFSPDGKTLASGSWDKTVNLWDIENGQLIDSQQRQNSFVNSVAFSPDGKLLAICGDSNLVTMRNNKTGEFNKSLEGYNNWVTSLAMSPNGKTLASGSIDNTIKLWNIESGQFIISLKGHSEPISSVAFSPDGKILASGSYDETIRLWNVESGQQIKSLEEQASGIFSAAFSPDGKILASGNKDNTISLWDVENGKLIKTLEGHISFVNSVIFSPDGKILASGSDDKTIKIWNIESGKIIKSLEGHSYHVNSVTFSPDGKILVSGSSDKTIRLWNVATGQQIRSLERHTGPVRSVVFSSDGKILASVSEDKTINLWNVENGEFIKSLEGHTGLIASIVFSTTGRFFISGGRDITIKFWNKDENKSLATLHTLNQNDWIITTPEGRFDTYKSLDNIKGLHWIVNDEILKPLPLDVFMRQYYEPNLLQRVLKCNEENNCYKEFKPLPAIAEINRVQPKVSIKEVKTAKNSSDLVDVTVEVESVTEDVNFSATARTKKEKKASGVYDLRLFRDEQLVGVSAPKTELEKFIKDAPRLVEETRASKKLIDTAEDAAWREANDLVKIAQFKNGKATFTFQNIKLPKDGREMVSFTSYAFNRDKVKSQTTEPFKFSIPKIVSAEKKKGKAVIVSIGVNVSENSAYDLRYAANDAREMQKIVGGNLIREKGIKYADIIQIPIISDYETKQTPAVNAARKVIVRSVFNILGGKKHKEVLAGLEKINSELAKEFKNIPNIEQLSQIEPEDTLIITYSGHGYADRSGIFYLLPSDIGKDTTKLTTENLQRTISSDELSLWMQEITAAEMIMIIDACHSAAAVQGDGFKPGPMGSRGLGQLAYDKDMKILSATQADNVALEIGSLQQGLLSYALLQDGIKNSLADKDKNKELFSAEWLAYAEERVPILYQDVKEGKRSVFVGGELIKDLKSRSEIIDLDNDKKANLNLQKPNLFDFKRRTTEKTLLTLP